MKVPALTGNIFAGLYTSASGPVDTYHVPFSTVMYRGLVVIVGGGCPSPAPM